MLFPDDYTIVQTDPAMSFAINTTAPVIEGNAQLGFSSPTSGPHSANMYITDPAERGFVRGVFRAFIRPNAQSGVGSVGFAFLQNQLDVATGGAGGQCYFAFFQGEFGTTQKVRVVKVTDGINGPHYGFTPALLSGAFPVPNGSFIPVEVEYNANPAVSGVELSLWRGAIGQTDFVGLTLVGSTIDTASPYMTSVAEGPACSFGTAQATPYDMDLFGFDDLVQD